MVYTTVSGVGTGELGGGALAPPNAHRRGPTPLQTLEGYNIIIIIPVSTKPSCYSIP